MPQTRTTSGKQVLSISITDAERDLIDRYCGPKEIGAFVGRLLRAYDTQTQLGKYTLQHRMDRIEQRLVELCSRKEMAIES